MSKIVINTSQFIAGHGKEPRTVGDIGIWAFTIGSYPVSTPCAMNWTDARDWAIDLASSVAETEILVRA